MIRLKLFMILSPPSEFLHEFIRGFDPVSAIHIGVTKWVIVHHESLHRPIKLTFNSQAFGKLGEGQVGTTPHVVIPLRSDVPIFRKGA